MNVGGVIVHTYFINIYVRTYIIYVDIIYNNKRYFKKLKEHSFVTCKKLHDM
jgi:hypothetical protein